MATRANIAIQNEDGTYDCIYTHWDGYGHYPILNKYYNSSRRARQLVELGAISVLDKWLTTSKPHSFDVRRKGVTVAYHRDRGEPLHIMRGLNLKECAQEEYLYVWDGTSWEQFDL